MKYDSPREGVEWHIWNRCWKAWVMVGGCRVNLGSYRDIDSAVRARKQGEVRYKYLRKRT